jgi:murein DD-endopeptidase MepM/ murein hydrolase activator NlpD
MICCFKGKFRVTSPRGTRILGGVTEFHKGIDLVGLDDITVYSISDGTVKTAYQANGAGYYVVVTMTDGRRVFYMHLKENSFKVKTGDFIKAGQPLGIMGSTGNSTGAHTHLEIRPKGNTSESLDICEFTGITNKKGLYEYRPEITPYEAACKIEDKCGLEKQTMSYLWKYKYANDLMLKLWRAMEK